MGKINIKTKANTIMKGKSGIPIFIVAALGCFLFATLIKGCARFKAPIFDEEWHIRSYEIGIDSTLKIPQQQTYTLTFHDRNQYNISFPPNTCSGTVHFKPDLKIEFESPSCTEICCDSADVQELLGILSEVTKYQYGESTLLLYNQEGKLLNLKNF